MPDSTHPFPSILQTFIDSSTWTYAKTMLRWPLEYLVRDRVDENLFVALVRHIREQGHEIRFLKNH